GGKPLPEFGEIRKRSRRRVHAQTGVGQIIVSLNYLATRFTCTWPWNTLVMLCDGRIVCGCADPYGNRVLGDARVASISQIWKDTTISTLRADLNAGGSRFCGDC